MYKVYYRGWDINSVSEWFVSAKPENWNYEHFPVVARFPVSARYTSDVQCNRAREYANYLNKHLSAGIPSIE